MREGYNALKPVKCFKTQKFSELSFSRNVSGKDMLRGTRLGAAWRMLRGANGEMVLSRSWNAPAAAEPARSPSFCLCRSLGGCRQSASSVMARRHLISESWGKHVQTLLVQVTVGAEEVREGPKNETGQGPCPRVLHLPLVCRKT